MELCSIHHLSIRKISAKFGIHGLHQPPDIGQNSDGGISDICISGQSLIKENCQNCRTSDDIDMNLGPVNKIDERKKATSKKLDDVEGAHFVLQAFILLNNICFWTCFCFVFLIFSIDLTNNEMTPLLNKMCYQNLLSIVGSFPTDYKRILAGFEPKNRFYHALS